MHACDCHAHTHQFNVYYISFEEGNSIESLIQNFIKLYQIPLNYPNQAAFHKERGEDLPRLQDS